MKPGKLSIPWVSEHIRKRVLMFFMLVALFCVILVMCLVIRMFLAVADGVNLNTNEKQWECD